MEKAEQRFQSEDICNASMNKLSDIRSRNNGDNQVDAIKEGLKWENIK
jgi:hypothetical protein